MDLHKRYVHSPTIDLSILELLETAFKDDPFSLLHRLVRYYDAEIIKESFDAKKLETLRTLLCYEYQLLHNSDGKYHRVRPVDVCFRKIENALLPQNVFRYTTVKGILFDVVILKMVLYCSPRCIEEHLINFRKSVDLSALSNSETRVFYLKALECFLHSFILRQYLHEDTDAEILKRLESLYNKDIILWLQIKEEKEWHSFATILPKLITIFGIENVLQTVWTFVVLKLEDINDILTALCIMVDLCFPSDPCDVTKMQYTLYSTEKLWTIIIQGLKSAVQQYRKQALYIMKRITEFGNRTNIKEFVSEQSDIVPFLCNAAIKTSSPINVVKEKFFLVLEALEEKQHHLVIPALTNVSCLIEANQEHASCNNCFNSVWIHLLFERILKHENNAVVKQGILHACKLDTLIYNEDFLEIFLNILNNTFLYECQTYEDEPEILNDVTTFFIRAQLESSDFSNRLLRVLDRISWGPIPIFYMMKTLRRVSEEVPNNHWGNNELCIVKSIVQKNLNMYSHILRCSSQIELLRTISVSINKINDLTLVASALYDFPSEGALTRGAACWDTITTWLRRILTQKDVIKFLAPMCETAFKNENFEMNSRKLAFIIVMLHDVGLILHHKSCTIERILNNWLSQLNGITTRPYADKMFGINATEFMSHLLIMNLKQTSESITRLVSSHMEAALLFLFANIRSIPYKFDYDTVNKYLNVITTFLGNVDGIISKTVALNYMRKFRNESIDMLENVNHNQPIVYICALRILCLCQRMLSISSAEFYTKPLLSTHDSRAFNDNHNDVNFTGKIASDYYSVLSSLMYQYITIVPQEDWSGQIDYFQNLSYLFEMGSKEVVPMIALILKEIVCRNAMKDPTDRENFESIFAMCWKSIFLSKKNKLFWTTIPHLIGAIVNKNFRRFTRDVNFGDQFLDQLLEDGNSIPKLKRILLNEINAQGTETIKCAQEPLLSCLLHGDVLRRDQKIENQAYLYIAKNYRECFPQHISVIDHNNDAVIRALSVTLLHKLLTTYSDCASTYLPVLLKRLEKYKNKRYFNHSYIHKIKHRIMQTLLVLQPYFNEADIATLQESICTSMLLESNQHSVRLMQEWILIRIFVQNESLHRKLWSFFEESIKSRPGCTSSVASIVYHVAQQLPSKIQTNFIQMGMKYIARCCLGQQFNMRLYNQVIFVKLYELLKSLNSNGVTADYRGLYDAALESLQDGNLMKNSNRIQDDFYLSVFHPMNDYSLQTIYFDFTRLTDMDADEWISPEVFSILNYKVTIHSPLLLYNSSESLSKTETSSYLSKSNTDQLSSLKNNMEVNHDGLSDIQKKIDPLSANPLYNDILSPVRQSIYRKKTLLSEEGIIVVASLIDRPPNLGGLARTCEIFGVKELVIANLNHVKDREFQSLSVSADKWITITEVKSFELQEYLLVKKDMGWCIVGAEQTANSTNLLNVKFNKKTILVLGNEKDGVPANLIPLFDMCIEVPQVGVIRSLNVHVTGAICIWQYAKQHIVT